MNKKEMAEKIERLEKLFDDVTSQLGNALSESYEIKEQVNCAEDYGHVYVFTEKVCARTGLETFGRSPLADLMTHGTAVTRVEPIYEYRHKCSRCGRVVDYTWDELTVKERHALETLGIVESKEGDEK
ncbi:hypothetical protein KAR91_57445 [Candidatus Pacearchaeota archaeon]|nr:hypothetical protein [Candidatus Pacearchaeota archaeon]